MKSLSANTRYETIVAESQLAGFAPANGTSSETVTRNAYRLFSSN